MADQKYPPDVSEGVFFVSSSAIIDAPREKVWKIILDFPEYKDWNPFVRGQTITDKSGKPLADQTPREDAFLLIAPVHMPPTMEEPTGWFQKQSAFERISVLDGDNFRVAWVNIAFPRLLLSAERWQMLSEVEVEGERRTKYETVEVFGGVLAYVLRLFFKGNLKLGFDAQAEGLKKWAERET